MTDGRGEATSSAGRADDRADAGLPIGDAAPACAFCGVVPDGAPPLSWSTAVEAGRTRWYCDRCTRSYVRDIEGKLDDAWWR